MAAAVAAGIATSASLSRQAALSRLAGQRDTADAGTDPSVGLAPDAGDAQAGTATMLMESYTNDFESFNDDADAGAPAGGAHRRHAAMRALHEEEDDIIEESIAEELEALASTPGSTRAVADE